MNFIYPCIPFNVVKFFPGCVTWRDEESNTNVQLPTDIAPGCTADNIYISVSFADGTFSDATYYGISDKWDSSFNGITPSSASGFLSSCKLHFLHHKYTDGLPLAWENCEMTYSNNFDLDASVVSQGSNFRASKSGWNYADFKVCCDDLTRIF